MNRIPSCLPLVLSVGLILLAANARADTVLEFQIRKSPAAAAKTQSVAIRNGRIMVKSAGGDANTDLLYSRDLASVKIVDHRERTVMTVDEGEVGRVNDQAQGVAPLLQGLGEQIARLSPEERRRWQTMLGDSVSLEKIARAGEPPEPIRLVPGGDGKVAGIKCRKTRVMEGATPLAELCLAEPAALRIPEGDYATIRSLLALYERLAARSQKLARQLGLEVPRIPMDKVAGVPVQLRDLSREEQPTVTLRRIRTTPVPPALMSVPATYVAKPLSLW